MTVENPTRPVVRRFVRVVLVLAFVLLTLFEALLGIAVVQGLVDPGTQGQVGVLIAVFGVLLVVDVVLFLLGIYLPKKRSHVAGHIARSTGEEAAGTAGSRWRWLKLRYPRTTNTLLWVLFVLTVAGLAAMIVVTVVEAVDPDSLGTPGTAVITHRAGQGTNQQRYGNFRSDDGKVSLTDTRIFDEDFADVGQTFTVYYDSSSRSVDALASGQNLSSNLVWVAWLTVLALFQFAFRVMIPRAMRIGLRRHRRRTRAAS